MNENQWLLIALLAIAAYAIRLAGLLGGQLISSNTRLKPILTELPGCLVVGLVAASLAKEAPATWLAALIALAAAIWTNNVVITMALGFAAIFVLARVIGGA